MKIVVISSTSLTSKNIRLVEIINAACGHRPLSIGTIDEGTNKHLGDFALAVVAVVAAAHGGRMQRA